MPYAPPSFVDLRTEALDGYRNLIPGADISEDSEIFARASTIAAALAMVSEGLRYVERQIFPDTADSGNLERHAALLGLERKDPTAAIEGEARLTGTNGTLVSAGLTLLHEDGTELITASGGTIASGELLVDVNAVTTGTAGNKIPGDELEVQSPPLGVDSTAEITVALSGGTDEETDAALSLRVLARMQAGNAGGTATDYEQWTLVVDGVLEAHCLPLRMGPGTVSVAVFSADINGDREAANPTLRAAVLAELNDQRPVTAVVDVPAITETALDVTVTALEVEAGFDSAEVASAVEKAIAAFIFGLRTGETSVLVQLGRAIAEVDGVKDFSLDAPAANVSATVDESTVEIFVPGAISVSA